MKNDPAVELCAGIERMKTPKLLLTTIVLLGLSGHLGITAETNSILPRFELILGIRTGPECAREVRDPLEFGVRNLSADKMSADECRRILMAGTVHMIAPDGRQYHSDALGWWRTRRPPELSRGDLATHPNCGSVDQYFAVRQPGRYLVWWTSGAFRSNTLVFDYADSTFRRLP